MHGKFTQISDGKVYDIDQYDNLDLEQKEIPRPENLFLEHSEGGFASVSDIAEKTGQK